MVKIKHTQGDTFSWAGKITLPTQGAWGVECAIRNLAITPPPDAPDAMIDATITLVGPNANDVTKTDYTLLLHCDGPDTAAWSDLVTPLMPVVLTAAIKFFDDATPPNELTSDPFQIVLSYNLVPRV